MNAFQESGPRGVETRPPQLFSLAFAVGVICFPGGVQPPQPPANFYPALECKSSYSASSNYMKLVQWLLMGGLLHLVQQGGNWAGPQSPRPLLAF